MGSDIPFLDETAILSDGAFPPNRAVPVSANGLSSNGHAKNSMLSSAQAMTAGKIFHGGSSRTNNPMTVQTKLHCMTGRSDYGE